MSVEVAVSMGILFVGWPSCQELSHLSAKSDSLNTYEVSPNGPVQWVHRSDVGANYAGLLLSSIWHSQMCQQVGRPGSCMIVRQAARVPA